MSTDRNHTDARARAREYARAVACARDMLRDARAYGTRAHVVECVRALARAERAHMLALQELERLLDDGRERAC